MSSKTPEEIAFELVAKLKGMGIWGEKNMADILDMYAECLDATQGKRKYIPGRCILEPADQAKLDAAHKQAVQRKAQQSAPQAQARPAQTQPVQAQPVQAQAAQAQPVQSAQAQQQMLQQAYKQA